MDILFFFHNLFSYVFTIKKTTRKLCQRKLDKSVYPISLFSIKLELWDRAPSRATNDRTSHASRDMSAEFNFYKKFRFYQPFLQNQSINNQLESKEENK